MDSGPNACMPHVVLSVTGVVGDDVPKAWESVGRDEAEMLFVCRRDKVSVDDGEPLYLEANGSGAGELMEFERSSEEVYGHDI